MTHLTVKKPKPARFPAYTIETEAGETVATLPILASGDASKLAATFAASPAFFRQIANMQPYVWHEAHGYTDDMAEDAISVLNGLIEEARKINGTAKPDDLYGEQEDCEGKPGHFHDLHDFSIGTTCGKCGAKQVDE